jgi:hypothetical protein
LVDHRCRGDEEEEEELVIEKKTLRERERVFLTSLQRRKRICKRKET